MAPFSNFISFIFLTTLLLPLQINARESQFFSKVTNANNNNAKETTTDFPNKEGPVNKPEQQQPAFIPETDVNSYGLYGHESPQNPTPTTSSTPTNYKPYYKTEFEDSSKYSYNKYDNNYDNNDAYNSNSHNEFSNTRLTGTGYGSNNYNYNNNYNKDAFEGYQNELSDTKYTEEGYNSMGNQNNHPMYYYDNHAANEKYTYDNNNNNNYNNYNSANNRYNGERQGMSDTRFMGGGKYYYDIKSEKYSTQLHGDAYKEPNNWNWRSYNNGNRGGHGNYNEYQNQENFEDELDDSEP